MLRRSLLAHVADPHSGAWQLCNADYIFLVACLLPPAGQGHPMKPHRVRMANSLVLHYGLHSKLDGVGRKGLPPADVGFGPCTTLALCRCWRGVCCMRCGHATGSKPVASSSAGSCCRAACHCSSKPTFPSLPRVQYYTPTRAGAEDMTAFHAEDYVDFLRTVTPDNMVCLLWTDDCSVCTKC